MDSSNNDIVKEIGNRLDRLFQPGVENVQLIYILFLVGFLLPIAPIVGLVIAYLSQSQTEEWLKTHYRFQIRTFWIALVWAIISALAVLIFIGFLGYLALGLWLIIRCVKGLQTVSLRRPIGDPASWLFG